MFRYFFQNISKFLRHANNVNVKILYLTIFQISLPKIRVIKIGKVKWIKGQRISWLGHLERIEEDRMPNKIFAQELEGTRRRGRLKNRWKEEVGRYLQVLVGPRRWRQLVAVSKKGRTLFDRPKPTVGFSANGRRRRRRRRKSEKRNEYLI